MPDHAVSDLFADADAQPVLPEAVLHEAQDDAFALQGAPFCIDGPVFRILFYGREILHEISVCCDAKEPLYKRP